MLREGPTDQNGGQFTIEKIKHFITQATEKGIIAHQDTVHFLGTILTDGVLARTLQEVANRRKQETL